jgi:hypothetical protein
VGPGSRITDCDKPQCHECRRHGGAYEVVADRPIAEISSAEVVRVVAADPEHDEPTAQKGLTAYAVEDAAGTERHRMLPSEPPEDLAAIEDPGRRLWEAFESLHAQNETQSGVEVVRLLDRAEELDLNRGWAADRLMSWLDSGRIVKAPAPNRIVPAWGDRARLDGANSKQSSLDPYR